MIHLFGILYADELRKCSEAEKVLVATQATNVPSYSTELNKMIKLSH